MLTQVRGQKVLDGAFVQQYIRNMWDIWPLPPKSEGQGPLAPLVPTPICTAKC